MRSAPEARRPARDIALALAIKLALVAALYALFSSTIYKPEADAAATASGVAGPVQNAR